jgi:hypothetical protein
MLWLCIRFPRTLADELSDRLWHAEDSPHPIAAATSHWMSSGELKDREAEVNPGVTIGQSVTG